MSARKEESKRFLFPSVPTTCYLWKKQTNSTWSYTWHEPEDSSESVLQLSCEREGVQLNIYGSGAWWTQTDEHSKPLSSCCLGSIQFYENVPVEMKIQLKGVLTRYEWSVYPSLLVTIAEMDEVPLFSYVCTPRLEKGDEKESLWMVSEHIQPSFEVGKTYGVWISIAPWSLHINAMTLQTLVPSLFEGVSYIPPAQGPVSTLFLDVHNCYFQLSPVPTLYEEEKKNQVEEDRIATLRLESIVLCFVVTEQSILQDPAWVMKEKIQWTNSKYSFSSMVLLCDSMTMTWSICAQKLYQQIEYPSSICVLCFPPSWKWTRPSVAVFEKIHCPASPSSHLSFSMQEIPTEKDFLYHLENIPPHNTFSREDLVTKTLETAPSTEMDHPLGLFQTTFQVTIVLDLRELFRSIEWNYEWIRHFVANVYHYLFGNTPSLQLVALMPTPRSKKQFSSMKDPEAFWFGYTLPLKSHSVHLKITTEDLLMGMGLILLPTSWVIALKGSLHWCSSSKLQSTYRTHCISHQNACFQLWRFIHQVDHTIVVEAGDEKNKDTDSFISFIGTTEEFMSRSC